MEIIYSLLDRSCMFNFHYIQTKKFSMLHNNVRSLKRNLGNLQIHLLRELAYNFNVIGVTEIKIRDNTCNDFNPELVNYQFKFVPTPLASGGVGMYIRDDLRYTVLEKCSNNAFHALWVEIELLSKPNIIVE